MMHQNVFSLCFFSRLVANSTSDSRIPLWMAVEGHKIHPTFIQYHHHRHKLNWISQEHYSVFHNSLSSYSYFTIWCSASSSPFVHFASLCSPDALSAPKNAAAANWPIFKFFISNVFLHKFHSRSPCTAYFRLRIGKQENSHFNWILSNIILFRPEPSLFLWNRPNLTAFPNLPVSPKKGLYWRSFAVSFVSFLWRKKCKIPKFSVEIGSIVLIHC